MEPHLRPDYEAEYVDQVLQVKRWRRGDAASERSYRRQASATVNGPVWRGIDLTANGAHWAYPPRSMDELDAAGRIHWPHETVACLADQAVSR